MQNRFKENAKLLACHVVGGLGQFGINKAINLSDAVTNVYNWADTHWLPLSTFQGLQIGNALYAGVSAIQLNTNWPVSAQLKADWNSSTWKDVAKATGVEFLLQAAAAEIAEVAYYSINQYGFNRDITEVTDYEKAAVRTALPGLIRFAGAEALRACGLFKAKPLDEGMNAPLLDEEKGQVDTTTLTVQPDESLRVMPGKP